MATSTLGSGTLVLAGTTSGTTTVTATAVAGTTTLTLPAATDTLVGKATTDTLTNKTLTTPSVSSPTISDGTANGVPYLNGSKVLTTGSALVFDGSNVGVGVTPSAWAANPKAIQIGTGGAIAGWTGAIPELDVSCNIYYGSSNYRYITTGKATLHVQYDGAYTWYNAPSGTAGNAITLTQAMTLDASGNLGIGLTSPGCKVDVLAASNTSLSPTIRVYSNNLAVNTALAYDGLVSNSQVRLYAGAASNVVFGINAAEVARIDSSGNLLVGTTTQSAGAIGTFYKTATSANQRSASFINNGTPGSTSPAGIYIYYPNASSGNGSTFITCSDSNSDRFYVLGSGNVQNTNNSYGAISDVKLKENIVDATPKLANLMQVKVRNYNMIGDTTKQIGVVAQELETIFPSMIDELPDKDADGNDLGTTTKSVKYSVFVPMLIKAMQEQQALITQLTARITALESA